jgi:peptidoglycan/LPS O-acetylase OafA/YrhL
MRKIHYLDGLRGLAAFVVVFHHFILAFYPALFLGINAQTHLGAGQEAFLSGSVFNLFYNGNFMVCIFFVLSGFVLSYKFFVKKDHEILTQSASKRYLRLVIPVAVSISLAFFLMKFSLFYNQQAGIISGSNWLGVFWRFTPNFGDALSQILLGTFFTNVYDYNVTLWTVAFEFFGSFLVLGFLALFGQAKNRSVAYVFAIIFFFQSYYLAFILGMLLSDLYVHRETFFGKLNKNKLIQAGLLLAGLFLGAYPSGRGVEGTWYASMEKEYLVNSAVLYHILGAFLLILVLLNSKRMQKIFAHKYLLFLGEISFSMYLLHFIVLGSFSSFIFINLAPRMQYAPAFLLTFVTSLALIIALSYLMYLYVDMKAVRFSKLVYNRVFKRS